MADKRPTSQHLKQNATHGIGGSYNTLKQLSSSGEQARSRRLASKAKQAAAAASAEGGSAKGGNNGGMESSESKVQK